MKLGMVVAVVLLVLPLVARAQETAEESKIQAEIDGMVEDHPVRLGILRVSPRLDLDAGYDSNAINSALVVESDTYTRVTPSADVAIKLGRRGYFAVREDLNFVYYATQDPLRDIYNTTAARLVTGSRKILWTINAAYLSRVAPYSGESDQPVEQTAVTGGTGIEWALRPRTDLRAFYSLGKLDFEPVEDLLEELPPPPDNRTWEAGGGFSQEMGRLISLDFQGSTGVVRILDPAGDTESNFWRALGGVTFEGNKLTGKILAGFGETDSTVPGEEPFEDFIIDTNVTYEAGRRLSFNVFVRRARRVSALLTDNFQLNTEFGFRATVPFSHRFFFDAGFTIGTNDYGTTPTASGVVIDQDDYRNSDAGINFILTEHITIRGSGGYSQRDSNDPILNKDRFTVGGGVVIEP